MRKAAVASALALVLILGVPPALLRSSAFGASARDAVRDTIPYANDWIFPVGNPRLEPSYDSTAPNGYQITQMFNNSCDPALGQGYYYAGQYWCGHSGVDLSDDGGAGGPVGATRNGEVVYAADDYDYGEMVRIEHVLPDGSVIYSQYEHMEYGSLQVVPGQIVSMGQTIGAVGATGFVTGPHLHFEIKTVNEPGPGYSFGNAALLIGYYDPIAFVVAHTQQLLPTPAPTLPPATATPSTQELGLSVAAPASHSALASNGGEHRAVLAAFYKRYHSYVTVTADHLNVRSGSGFSYAPMNSVIKGARLGYLGLTGNGWIHVALPGNVYGYVARQWVEGRVLPKLPPISVGGKLKPPFAWVLDARYPARSGPLMRDAAIEVLKRGERLTYLGTLGSWDKVVLPSGRVGWVLDWYLRDPARRINLAPPRPTSVAVACPCVVTTPKGLNLRAGPGLSARVLESLPKGTKLSLRGYHTSWAAVVAPDGTRGYVMNAYVRPIGNAAAPSRADRQPPSIAIACPCVVTLPDGLNLRAGPRLAAPVLESLPQGTKLGLRGYHTSWIAVIAPDGTRGYVLAQYVQVGQTVAPAPTAAAATDTATPTATTAPADSAASTTATPTATASPTPATASSSDATGTDAQDGSDQLAPGYAAPFVYVTVDHANIRAAPSLKAEVWVSRPLGTKLALLGSRGPWDHVETAKGVIGWIDHDLVGASKSG